MDHKQSSAAVRQCTVRVLGQSLMLERKQRISIAGRANHYVKNTQTKVRGWRSTDEKRSDSMTTNDEILMITNVEVDELQKKIESEIGKLKKLRKSILEEHAIETRSRTVTKQTQCRTKTRDVDSGLATGVSIEPHKNLRPLSSEDFTGNPYFRTICVIPPPHRSNRRYGKPVPRKRADRADRADRANRADRADRTGSDGSGGSGKHVMATSSKQSISRICGGCIYGCYNNSQMPCTVYQNDYCHWVSAPLAEYGPYSTPCPYNFCYQPAMSELHVPKTCQMRNCGHPFPYVFKRKTDLNTEELCQQRRADAAIARHGTKTASTQWRPRTKCAPPKMTSHGRGLAKERTKSSTVFPTRRHGKTMKISCRKQPAKVLSGNSRSIEKMLIKQYVAPKERVDDDSPAHGSSPKMHMHRQYMKMYTTEQKKSVNKGSSQTVSDLDKCPTYTIISGQMENIEHDEPCTTGPVNGPENTIQQMIDFSEDCDCLSNGRDVSDVATECSEEQRLDTEDATSDESLHSTSLAMKHFDDDSIETESEPDRIPCPVVPSKEEPTKSFKTCFTQTIDMSPLYPPRSCQNESTTYSHNQSPQTSQISACSRSGHQEAPTNVNYDSIQYLDSEQQSIGVDAVPGNSVAAMSQSNSEWMTSCPAIPDPPARENKRVRFSGSQSARPAHDTISNSIPWHNLMTQSSNPLVQPSYNELQYEFDVSSQEEAANPNYCEPDISSLENTEPKMDGGHGSNTAMPNDSGAMPVYIDQTAAACSDLSQPLASQSPCKGVRQTLMFNMLSVTDNPKCSVTFEDESGYRCRCTYREAQQPTPLMQRIADHPICEEDHYNDTDDQFDSYRSSSTANTEFTCDECQYEDGYYTCARNRNASMSQNRIPPFTGCICMLNEYIQLASTIGPKLDMPGWRPIE